MNLKLNVARPTLIHMEETVTMKAICMKYITHTLHCTKTYIPTTWESIGYADGNVLNPAN